MAATRSDLEQIAQTCYNFRNYRFNRPDVLAGSPTPIPISGLIAPDTFLSNVGLGRAIAPGPEIECNEYLRYEN